MSTADGYLTNPLYREIKAILDQAGVPFRVERGGRHWLIIYKDPHGQEWSQPLHLGTHLRIAVRRKTIKRFQKIASGYAISKPGNGVSMSKAASEQGCLALEVTAPDVPRPEGALALALIDEEPRIYDLDLAKRLGMADRHKIRELIKSHMEELAAFGGVSARRAETGAKGGRPGTAYYLNREQALLVCILARTERAKQVRADVVRVYSEWQDSRPPAAVAALPPPLPASDLHLAKEDFVAVLGAVKGVVAKQVSTAMEKAIGDLAAATLERDRHLYRALEGHFQKPVSAVVLHSARFIEVGGVYEVAGVICPIPARGKLSGNVTRSLDAFCKRHGVAPRSAPIGNGNVTHWPRETVLEWLAEDGRDLIERHLVAHAPKLALVAPVHPIPSQR